MRFAEVTLSAQDRRQLLTVARSSIRCGLQSGRALAINPTDYPQTLRPLRATFVTLHLADALRGCIGALQAELPLVEDVALHAYAAAFDDPRFPGLQDTEFESIEIHISMLSPPTPLPVQSQTDLLGRLRPGIDGLTMRHGDRHATFLPSVWESLAEPEQFFKQLKLKAGLSPDYWSDSLRFERYTTESFGE